MEKIIASITREIKGKLKEVYPYTKTKAITNNEDVCLDDILDNKVDKVDGEGLSTNDFTNQYKEKLDNLDINLDNKVDKVIGKGLSTNDLTDELKESYDNTVNNSHTHENKTIIDKLGEDSNGKLLYDGSTISADANITIDSVLSSTSENPVQNKAINNAITNKVDKVEGKSLISDTEIERLSTITNYDDTEINNTISNKVDKIEGKSLSTNDLTNELKKSYDNTVNNSHNHTNKTIIDKLGEDSNGKLLYNGSTLDASITIDSALSSTSENPVQNKAINNALDTKVDKVIGKSLISDTEIVRLSNITNYDDTEINNALDTKVDKVIGKSLSTNDLTNELKESYDNTVNNSHTHENKEIVDKFSEDSNGKLLYNNESICEDVSISSDVTNALVNKDDGLYVEDLSTITDIIDSSGDGTKYLSNDGTYKVISSGSNVTVPSGTTYTTLWEGQVYSKNSTIELSESFKNYDQLILCGAISYSDPGINKCQFSILTSDIEPSTICDEYIFFWYSNTKSNRYSSLHFTSNTEMIIDTVASNSSTEYGAFTKIVGIKY